METGSETRKRSGSFIAKRNEKRIKKLESKMNDIIHKEGSMESLLMRISSQLESLQKRQEVSSETSYNGIGRGLQNSYEKGILQWHVFGNRKAVNERFNATSFITKGAIAIINNEEITSLLDLTDELDNIFDKIIKSGLPEKVESQDMISIVISNPNLSHDISVPFRSLEQYDPSMVTAEIMRVNQSKKDFLLNGEICVNVTHVKLPRGGGSYREIDFNKWRTKAKSVVRVVPDGMCCARSIVVAKAYVDGIRGVEWDRIRNNKNNTQTQAAERLCNECGVRPYSECGLDELKLFDQYLSERDYQLFVCDQNTRMEKTFIFKGQPCVKQIFILYINNHYDALTSILSLLQASYFCPQCSKAYNNRYDHNCEFICDHCYTAGICKGGNAIICTDCNRLFMNNNCHKNHKDNGICSTLWKCKTCCRVVKGRSHRCNERVCLTCKEKIAPGVSHDCYVQPLSLEKLKKHDREEKIFVFYDFESCLEEVNELSYEHFPNLCVAQVVCDNCWCSENRFIKDGLCSLCNEGKKVFYGLRACDDFCVWLFSSLNKMVYNIQKQLNLKHTINVYVIAHNAKAYDLQFILRYLVQNNKTPEILKNGNKLYRLRIGRFIFLDSVNFIPLPLKKFPKTFGCKTELKKGWFPYLFNKKENIYYKGNWPEKKHYSPDFFSLEERQEFEKWFETQKNNFFDMQTEILAYCEMDVQILTECVMYFRDCFKYLSGIDPFTRAVTIPMAVMEVFRACFLKPFDMCIVPYTGFEPQRRSSFKGNCWIDYTSLKNEVSIIKEFRLGNYYADGFDKLTKTAYEFLGCVFHGCLNCFPKKRWFYKNPFNQKTMIELYEETQKKINYYKNENINVVIKWECDYDNDMKKDKEFKTFVDKRRLNLKKCSKLPPLEPRDAFFGGRVNAFKLYYEAKEGESIRYLDFTSLYPYIQKYGKYPRGKPTIIKDFINNDITKFEGLIFCKVLPPGNLKYPILPMRNNVKVLFPLCRVCAETRQQSACHHTNEERSLVGCWVSDELKYSIRKGYIVTEIYEVWHFKETRQRFVSKEGGIFDEFQNKFLKIKVANSGFPKSDMTLEEKHAYVNGWNEKEGISLSVEEVCKNEGWRAVGKQVITSEWGKHGQKANKKQTELIKNPDEFYSLLANPTIEVSDAYIVSPQVMLVSYESKFNYIVDPAHSNIIIAAYTTALARLKLHKLMEFLGDRLLYCDTDSTIFVSSDKDDDPPTGYFLGELTDEITDKYGCNWYISRFLSGGPKNYSLEVKNAISGEVKYEIKVKGITLNFATKKVISFESMKQVLLKQVEELRAPQMQFQVDNQLNMFTKHTNKKYRFFYDKRRLEKDFNTLPFGFKKC